MKYAELDFFFPNIKNFQFLGSQSEEASVSDFWQICEHVLMQQIEAIHHSF